MSGDVRTFGGWRERRGFGLAGLSGGQTAGVLAGVIVCLGVALVAPSALVVVAVPLLAIVAAVGVRIRGETVAGAMERHGRFHWARRRGATSYRSAATPALPGALSDVQILEVQDAGGRPAAVVWSRARRTVTALVPLEPVGVGLVDADEVARWLRGWGDWLAHLGYVPELRHVMVTVRTGRLPVGAPVGGQGLAAAVLTEISHAAQDAPQATTIVSLTMGGAAAGSLENACAGLFDAVSSMAALTRCGVSVLPPLGTAEVVGWVRGCYDPVLGAGPGSAGMREMAPTAAEEQWSAYRHDGAVSVGYVWQEPPGTGMAPDVLARLLGPADYDKRVCLVFEPMPAHEAAREVERQAEAAVFRREYRRRLGRDETSRERVDVQRARQTADDQAGGAGIVDVGLYAVATVVTPSEMAAAAADLENRAGEARLRLRRNYGAQADTFACTLGLGFVPARRW